mmetsp:Transcript_93040/g.135944  ORF Transcript_93040/g.135944 Transcript_93040/m.135944 type:complete len:94 (-) Transcript_93040:131-412(-)
MMLGATGTAERVEGGAKVESGAHVESGVQAESGAQAEYGASVCGASSLSHRAVVSEEWSRQGELEYYVDGPDSDEECLRDGPPAPPMTTNFNM